MFHRNFPFSSSTVHGLANIATPCQRLTNVDKRGQIRYRRVWSLNVFITIVAGGYDLPTDLAWNRSSLSLGP